MDDDVDDDGRNVRMELEAGAPAGIGPASGGGAAEAPDGEAEMERRGDGTPAAAGLHARGASRGARQPQVVNQGRARVPRVH